MDELLMKHHPLDTLADALILSDIGKVNIQSNNTSFERHLRIKFFRKTAFKEWGHVSFKLEKGSLTDLKATTYNLVNGTIQSTSVSKEAVYKGKTVKGIQEISCAFENLQEGSVVELTYSELSYGFVIPFWKFQHTIPTLLSEYSIDDPYSNLRYKYHITGSHPLSKHLTTSKDKYQRWAMTDVPAFKRESSMPDIDVYRAGIMFYEENGSWAQIHGEYWISPSAAGVVRDNEYLIKKTRELTSGLSAREKVKAISNYIKSTVKWNGVKDIFAEEPRFVLEKNEGTAADINLLFGSMLEKAGFEVDLILLSTRDHGDLIFDFPSFRQFNYVICRVMIENTEMFLDATDPLLPFDMLPIRCLNHRGFLVASDMFGWVNIEPAYREKISIQADLQMDSLGQIHGTVKQTNDGYAGYESRKTSLAGGENALKKNLLNIETWDASELKVGNLDDIHKPVLLEFKIQMKEGANQNGERIYFQPFLFLRNETNPFIVSERTFPVDFDRIVEKVIIFNILLPDGYTPEELPASKVFAVPENGAKFTFHIAQSGQRLLITTKLQINKTLFMPNEYLPLREFYSRMIAKNSEMVVLRKS
jgi:hypothetical protein